MKLMHILLIFLLINTGCMTAAKQSVDHIEWREVASLPAPPNAAKQYGLAGAFVGLSNNALIVAGGANFPDSMPWAGGKKRYYSDGYVFQRNASGNVEFKAFFQLPSAVAYGASCKTANGIVCVGGETYGGLSNKAMLLQWNPQNNQVIIRQLADLPFAVANACMAADGNLVYLAGGERADTVSDRFLVLDITADSAKWQQLPRVPKPLSHSVMVIQDNSEGSGIYLIGGRKKNNGSVSDLSQNVYRFDTEQRVWHNEEPLPYALSAGTGLAANDNDIVLFGGDSGETFSKTEKLIFAIAAEKDSVKREQLNRQKINLQTNHPGFNKAILVYNTVTKKWRTAGLLPFETQVTTTAVKWNDEWIVPSGEIKAGVRTPRIIAGTPSN